jgi:hypothetical protein
MTIMTVPTINLQMAGMNLNHIRQAMRSLTQVEDIFGQETCKHYYIKPVGGMARQLVFTIELIRDSFDCEDLIGASECQFLQGVITVLVLFFHLSNSLYSSLGVRDHVSHPYEITGKIIVLYILILTFLDRRME